MVVSIAVLEQGNNATDEPFTTAASITWSGGVGMVLTASAWDDVGVNNGSHVITAGGTWVEGASVATRLRRVMSLSTNISPTNATLTINPSSNVGTYQDTIYFVCEVSGTDGVVPTINTQVHADAQASPQPITLTDTIHAGDLAVLWAICESSTASHALEGGLTAVGTEETSTNTRSGLVGSTTSDTNPGHNWTGGNQGHGEIALVWNVSTPDFPPSLFSGLVKTHLRM